LIGWAANSDFTFPLDVSKSADIEAASRRNAFSMGWFTDPLVFGRYPKEMTDRITDGRLPEFTPEESEMLMKSWDFLGINHYGS